LIFRPIVKASNRRQNEIALSALKPKARRGGERRFEIAVFLVVAGDADPGHLGQTRLVALKRKLARHDGLSRRSPAAAGRRWKPLQAEAGNCSRFDHFCHLVIRVCFDIRISDLLSLSHPPKSA